MLLARLARDLVRDGALTLVDVDGTTHRLGRGARPRSVVVRLHAPRGRGGLALVPGLGLRDAYADGSLTIERGEIAELIDLYAQNLERLATRSAWARAARAGFFAAAERAAARCVGSSALGATSGSAYFVDPSMVLEEAEEAHKRHLAAKLVLRAGQRVLQIGGAGSGLSLHLAAADVDVTVIEASDDAFTAARRRATDAGFAGRVGFHRRTLHEETGRYDRIVALGAPEPRLFTRVREMLAEDGVAVVERVVAAHGARARGWGRASGAAPTLSQLVAEIERARLQVTDAEPLRLHHAEALRYRRERLLASFPRAAETMGPAACRALEVDLALAEAAFRQGGLVMVQLQIAKRADAVPITRAYLDDRVLEPRSVEARRSDPTYFSRGLSATSSSGREARRTERARTESPRDRPLV